MARAALSTALSLQLCTKNWALRASPAPCSPMQPLQTQAEPVLQQPHSWHAMQAAQGHLALLACPNPASLRSTNRELAALNSVTSTGPQLSCSHTAGAAGGEHLCRFCGSLSMSDQKKHHHPFRADRNAGVALTGI